MTLVQKKMKTYLSAVLLLGSLLLMASEAFAQTATIRFSFSSYTVNEAAGVATVSVARSGNIASVVSVDYVTTNGTALDGFDYIASLGTLTFLANETKKTFTVPIIDDVLNENNETISLTLSNPVGGAVLGTPSTATLIIIDNDPAPNLSIDDVTVTEGNSGTVNAVFTVTLSAQSGKTVFVDYGVGNGTATAGSDFLPNSGTFSFLPGETSKMITVVVNGDILNEADETYNVILSNAVNAGVTKTIGVGTILNDDPAPTISINDISVLEGNVGTTNANFTVTLSTASGQPITVSYATADGTALAGSDYIASSGTVTFFPGETSKTLSVAVNGDLTFEPDETFIVNLSAPTGGATITRSKGSCTIVNDDALPTISIGGVSLAEGNVGTSNAVFTVTLSAASVDIVTVNFATANGTAIAGPDYVAASGTLTFAPGETSKNITVLVNGNTLYQPDKTFFVNLSTPTNATIGTPQATGTILNDDTCPVITVAPATLPNGTVGSAYNQTVSASGGTAPYAFTVSSGTLPAGLTLASGVLSGTPTTAGSSTFTVTATDVNGCVGNASYSVTVIQMPSLSINDVSVFEGDKDVINAVFTVTLSAASTQAVSVSYATANGTAIAGRDYTAKSGTLTFAPGTTTQTITIAVKGDREREANETFLVNLSAPVNATIADGSGTCTIVNTDGWPKIHINNESIAEGNTGTKQMIFTVHISKKWNAPVTVDYATADGSAQAGSDYVATSGTLTFAAGENKKSIAVTINGDMVYEDDETFTVNLSNPMNGKFGDDQAKGTIRNDDPKPRISINNVAMNEGDSGTSPMEFTVSLSNPSSRTISVRYKTENGSARSSSDYIATSGTVTFSPGETSKTITVLINGDTQIEKDETFYVELSHASNGREDHDSEDDDDAKGKGTILNDDPAIIAGSTVDGGAAASAVAEEAAVQLPTEFTLSQNYPNPFNPSTTIRYTLPNTASVKLQIYNALGEMVATLVDREQAAGTYQFQWQAKVPSGVYFYRLVAGNFVETKRMILMK